MARTVAGIAASIDGGNEMIGTASRHRRFANAAKTKRSTYARPGPVRLAGLACQP